MLDDTKSETVKIPFSTFALNVNKKYLSKVKVNILYPNLKLLEQDCTLFTKNAFDVSCKQVTVLYNIGVVKYRAVGEIISKNIDNAILEFVDIKMVNPPIIPQGYKFPKPISFSTKPVIEILIQKLINNYFGCTIPFAVIARCLFYQNLELFNVQIESNKTIYNIISFTILKLEACIIVETDIHQKLKLKFDTKTIEIITTDLFQPQFLLNPNFIYGKNTTNFIPLSYRCFGPIIASQHQFYSYEHGLLKQYKEDYIVSDPIRLQTSLHLKPCKKLYNLFTIKLKNKFTDNQCILEILNDYEHLKPIERHIFAKQNKIEITNLTQKLQNVSKGYLVTREILKNIQDLIAQKQILEEKMKEYGKNYIIIGTNNPFLDKEKYSDKFILNKLKESNLTNSERYFLMIARKSRNIEFANDVLKQKDIDLLNVLQKKFFINPKLILDTQHEIETINNKINENNQKELQENELLFYFDHKLQFSAEEYKVYLQLIILYYLRHGGLNEMDENKLTSIALKYYATRIDQIAYKFFKKEIPISDDSESTWKKLLKMEKLLFYYLSFDPKYPDHYDERSLRGFLYFQQPECMKDLLVEIDID